MQRLWSAFPAVGKEVRRNGAMESCKHCFQTKFSCRIEADMINPALNDVPFGLGYVLYNLVVCLLGFICWADRWDIFIPFSQELVGISRLTGARLGKVWR